MNRHIVLNIVFLLIAGMAQGRTVSFNVVDKESGSPLAALICLEYNNADRIELRCDNAGRASVEYPDSASVAMLEISYDGRLPILINLPMDRSVNLGAVELERAPVNLQELTVYGDNSTIRAGKRSLVPSAMQIKRNYSATQLLSDMQSIAPELRVDQVMHTITIDGEAPVFQVNGRLQKMDRLIDLNPEQIARIEMTNYRDLQYNAPVFNIILKPASKGGSVSLYTQEPVTTLKSYTKATGTFNYKKSEFFFDYQFVYRNSSDEIANASESYIAPEFNVRRTERGLPSGTIDQDHRFILEYTLIPDKHSTLVLSGEATMHRNHNIENSYIYQKNELDGTETAFNSRNKRGYKRNPFSFGAFYRYLKERHRLEVSSSISRSSGDYNRTLTYSNGYVLGSRSHNSGFSSGTNVDYSLRLPSDMSMTVGAQYRYMSSSSDYLQVQKELTQTQSDMNSHMAYVYGKLGWSHRGFSVVGGPGLRYYSSNQGEGSFLRWRGVVSVSQNIGRTLSGNYTITVDPSFPSSGNLSDVVQKINDYTVSVGNPYLKSSMSISHNIRFNYRLNKFRASPYAIYRHESSPILTEWSYSAENSCFIQSVDNGRYLHNLTAGLTMSLFNLLGKINLSTDIGVNRFWVDNHEGQISKCHLFWQLNATGYFGPVNVSVSYMPVRGLQLQGYSYSRSMAVNSITAYYRYRNFQFGVIWQSPLTRRAYFNQTYSLSNVHPKYSEYYIKDFNNMVLLSVQYRFGFGDVYNKPNISTDKVSTTDVLIAY